MTSALLPPYRPSLGDRIGIACFLLVGAGIVVWGAIAATLGIADLAGGAGVTAPVGLIDTVVELPIADTDRVLAVEIDTALVTAEDPSGGAIGLTIAAIVARFLVVAAIVLCLSALARNTIRGRIFSRGNTVLITTAGMTALVGFGLVTVLERMVGNTIISQLTDGRFENFAVLAADPLPFVLIAFAFGIVSTAYTIGARLQHDQEGLV